jgi:hypothetical protein
MSSSVTKRQPVIRRSATVTDQPSPPPGVLCPGTRVARPESSTGVADSDRTTPLTVRATRNRREDSAGCTANCPTTSRRLGFQLSTLNFSDAGPWTLDFLSIRDRARGLSRLGVFPKGAQRPRNVEYLCERLWRFWPSVLSAYGEFLGKTHRRSEFGANTTNDGTGHTMRGIDSPPPLRSPR